MTRSVAASILADSVTMKGERLTTFEITLPRIVLSEFNTHSMISRNSASSRAVPVHRKVLDVLSDPYVPVAFGRNRPGMQASEDLAGDDDAAARAAWLRGRDRAVRTALELVYGQAAVPDSDDPDVLVHFVEERGAAGLSDGPNVHKQIANRVLEPYMWHLIIATATHWTNFLALRSDEGAQPDMRDVANAILEGLRSSTPATVQAGGWHLPFLQAHEIEDAASRPDYYAKLCVARCARVSYLTHHGEHSASADLALHDRLRGDHHLSPFEHVAQALDEDRPAAERRVGKLTGWRSLRSTIPDEDDYARVVGLTI